MGFCICTCSTCRVPPSLNLHSQSSQQIWKIYIYENACSASFAFLVFFAPQEYCLWCVTTAPLILRSSVFQWDVFSHIFVSAQSALCQNGSKWSSVYIMRLWVHMTVCLQGSRNYVYCLIHLLHFLIHIPLSVIYRFYINQILIISK